MMLEISELFLPAIVIQILQSIKELVCHTFDKYSLRMGWRNFFSSCAVESVFWFLVGNRFWCYLLTYLEYNTVVALC